MTEKSVSGVSAWGRLYEELLGAIRVDLDGDEIGLEEAMSKLYSGDRDLRRRSAEAVTESLAPGLRTRTYVFNTIVLDKSIDDRLRGYETWISSRNLRNETSDEAVQALVDAAVARYDVPQRYYRLKAKLIDLDRLTFYDRMAPIAEDVTTVSWQEAKDSVLGAYADFSQETGDIVERFFDESWIDAAVRENKRTGAFCATTIPDRHPYILMNFTGDRRSVLTLAHELGHGLHGVLSNPLGLFNADTPLTTAETASVFGEALTFKRLLALEEDPRRRLNLLAGRIEDAIATVFRQITMNRFEDAAHTERRRRASSRSRGSRSSGSTRRARCSATPWTSTATARGGATSRTSCRRRATCTRTRTASCSRSRSSGATSRRARRWWSPTSRSSGWRLAHARGARGDRRPRPHRRQDLGERHRGARGRARRGRGARRGDRAGLTLSGRGSG